MRTKEVKEQNELIRFNLSLAAIDVDIQIWPYGDPLKATVGEPFTFACEAFGMGTRTSSLLTWYKKTSNGEIEVDRSLIRREGYFHIGKGIDNERIEIKSPTKAHSGTYICKRRVPYQRRENMKLVHLIVEGIVFEEMFLSHIIFTEYTAQSVT